jgi:hypothetical protein
MVYKYWEPHLLVMMQVLFTVPDYDSTVLLVILIYLSSRF